MHNCNCAQFQVFKLALITELQFQEVSDATLAFLIDEVLTVEEGTALVLLLFYGFSLRNRHLFTIQLNEDIFWGIWKKKKNN